MIVALNTGATPGKLIFPVVAAGSYWGEGGVAKIGYVWGNGGVSYGYAGGDPGGGGPDPDDPPYLPASDDSQRLRSWRQIK